MSKEVYFDVETTGLKPGQIGQLSLIVNNNGQLSAENYFFEVDYVNPDVTKKFGRGINFYKEKSKGIKFKDKKDEIYNMVADADLIVGHNVDFDINFLTTEFWRLGVQLPIKDRFDTMKKYKGIIKVFDKTGRIKNPNLSELANHLNLDNSKTNIICEKLFEKTEFKPEFHDSTYDITVTFLAKQLYMEMNLETKKWTDLVTLKTMI